MSNCINKNCRLCRNIVISTSVTIITVDGTDTLVINIPAGFYPDCSRVCLVVAQTIPTTATITMPVAISIGGNTTVVYPIVNCDCTQVTACAIRTRTKYGLRINTTATSAVFKTLKQLCCYPEDTLAVIPVPATPVAPAVANVVEEHVALRATRTAAAKANKTTDKGVEA